ncbi:hypothetical protein PG994_004873 [Apiospora phragmitis]|uniref:Uncharacterized protein n=1 Tax=Apiospora phragmitis TaxID=2905665 RepID=A0ABR1VRU2_9PEZI
MTSQHSSHGSSQQSSDTASLVSTGEGPPRETILNTGFLYICGDRAAIRDNTSQLYDTLAMHHLVPEWPNMGRQVETCCADC